MGSFEDRTNKPNRSETTIVAATSHRGALGSIANAAMPRRMPSTVPATRNSDRPSAP